MTYNEDEAKELLKKHEEKPEQWVIDARQNNTTLKALVTGDGFHDELINRIEHLESVERASVRKKYSKDIRDLFNRIFKKRQNVFDANGGSENLTIDNEKIAEDFTRRTKEFKASKSLFNYLAESYFGLKDIDPNGVIMLEYKAIQDGFDLYPSYKSIHDIRHYKSSGQLVDYIVFEPIISTKADIKTWRIVDAEKDYTFIEIGGNFILDKDKTFKHPFGKVPCVILSEANIIGSEVRISPVNPIIELSKDYARDKSILTIYKFQNGMPIHWRYGSKCKTCNGLGKTGNQTCTSCDGKGNPKKSDVSDMHILPIPKDGQPFLGDKVAGFSSPDLDTWKQYKEDLRDAELLMDDTIWGTDKTHQSDTNNETATGRYIDIQPITNTLNNYSDVAEYVYNTFANWVINFVDLSKKREEIAYHRSFGRHYIIESLDVLTERYGKSKLAGDNNTILDKQLEEIILSKYKNDPLMQSRMLKKAQVEPYIHLSIKEVFEYYGAVESNKKVLFQKFWQDIDIEKTVEQLSADFSVFFTTNNTIVIATPPAVVA